MKQCSSNDTFDSSVRDTPLPMPTEKILAYMHSQINLYQTPS